MTIFDTESTVVTDASSARQSFGQAERRRGALVITARAAGRVSGMGLGHAFASASRFRKAASPASDTSTHFGSGAELGT